MTVNAHSCLKMYGVECLFGTQIEDDKKRYERKEKSNVYVRNRLEKNVLTEDDLYFYCCIGTFINILLFILSIYYEQYSM